MHQQLQAQLETRSGKLVLLETKLQEKEIEYQGTIAKLSSQVESLEIDLAASTSPLLAQLAAAEQQAAAAREETARAVSDMRLRIQAESDALRNRFEKEKEELRSLLEEENKKISKKDKEIQALRQLLGES
ncbi:tpr mlp1 mlp2-like, partial [Cystoisospora suis]